MKVLTERDRQFCKNLIRRHLENATQEIERTYECGSWAYDMMVHALAEVTKEEQMTVEALDKYNLR